MRVLFSSTFARPVLGSEQGLLLPLIQMLWCFGMVNLFGCWGCVAGAAGVGATTQFTYKIAQFSSNWLPLGVALWSLVLIVCSEAAFLWGDQAVLRSAATLLPAIATMWLLFKSVGLHVHVACRIGVSLIDWLNAWLVH